MSRHTGWVLLAVVLLLSRACAADLTQYRNHFQQWYAGWSTLGPQLVALCPEDYEVYLSQNRTYCQEVYNGPCASKSTFVHPLVACMLKNMDELSKAEIATSQIIMGLLPAILIFMSSSCLEYGLMAQRRPILTFILAAASPGLSPMRRYDYYSESQYLLTQPSKVPSGESVVKIQPRTPLQGTIVSLVEYVLALAAVANNIHNTWQICVFTISIVSPETAYSPMLWVIIAFALHLIEIGCVYLLVARDPKSTWVNWFWLEELRPCSLHGQIRLEYNPETLRFRVASFVSNKLIILFIVWGTFYFSSVLFVKITDALVIVLRYIASVVVARLVLQYELDGMSMTVIIPKWMKG